MPRRQAKNLLIVITDADNLSALDGERTLHEELARRGQTPVGIAEPIVILVPKWQVETWVKCLHGQPVLEDDPHTDRPPVTAAHIIIASSTLYDWARPNAQVGATCVDSLMSALPRWLRIG